jgi:cold shock CspA family protein
MTVPEKYPRVQGVVKVWIDSQNYGFITGDDGAQVYVHANAVQRPDEPVEPGTQLLAEGDRVEYQLGGRHPGPKPMQADNVVKL